MNDKLTYISHIRPRHKLIYVASLLFCVSVIISSPFIFFDISISSPGSLKPGSELTNIILPIGGTVKYLKMADNLQVNKNDTIALINTNLPDNQGLRTKEQIERLRQNLADLVVLLNTSANGDALTSDALNNELALQTSLYNASWRQFAQELNTALQVKDQSQATLNRYQKLFENGVITVAEHEKYKFDNEQAKSACLLLIKKYRTQWQMEKARYKEELSELSGKEAEITEQKKLYVLIAPLKGSLQNIAGIQVGSYVFASQKIAEISPDEQLIAYCYVKPSDIGLISKGQEVRMNIDAFNYNQWGFITGTVLDISEDILMMDNRPFFKVKCALQKNYLKLKNGYIGHLKKGMTFNAHFKIAKRSLYQLFYDKIDNWVNPSLNPKLQLIAGYEH